MLSCQQEISRFLLEHSIKDTGILVGLSGGPDSVALLHLLNSQAQCVESHSLAAAHVNYGLRGADSDDDESYCRELCEKLGIKLHVLQIHNRPPSGNMQQWAREQRYAFFNQLCDSEGYGFIALGHNLDDNVETIIMNLARGAGSFGLSGMDSLKGRLLRPLLNCSRAEIVEYLESHDIRFRIDQTNLEEKYLRNKVRKRLLPMMRELFGDAVERNIHRAGAIFAEHESLLRQIAGEETDKVTSRTPFGKLVLDLTRFRQYHPLIRRALVALSFEQLTGSLTNFEHAAVERVFSAANKGSGKADLKGGLIAEVIGERLYIYRGKQECLPMELEVPGTTHLEDFGLVVTVELAPSAETSTATLRGGRNLRIYLDADELPRELWIRNWSPGDRFTPLGMVGSKSLADFLTDRGVDRPLREEIPILYGRGKQGDQIFWVVGYEIADYAKITERTKRITKLEVLPYRGV